MLKGINLWTMSTNPWDMGRSVPRDIRQCLDMAKDAGFDGVELVKGLHREISNNSTKKDILEVKQYADDIGIEIFSLVSQENMDCFISSKNKEKAMLAKEDIMNNIDIASILGVRQILVLPVSVDEDNDYIQSHLRGIEQLKELADYAKEKDVTIGIENIPNKALLSPFEMKWFIESVGSTSIGCYLDLGNCAIWSNPIHWIYALREKIIAVHVKDYNYDTKRHCDLYSGNIDFNSCIKALKDIGYDKWVTAEISPPYNNHPELTTFVTAMSMKKMIDS